MTALARPSSAASCAGAGAKSPLLENYASVDEEMLAWSEMRRNAEAAALRYPDKPPHADKEASGD